MSQDGLSHDDLEELRLFAESELNTKEFIWVNDGEEALILHAVPKNLSEQSQFEVDNETMRGMYILCVVQGVDGRDSYVAWLPEPNMKKMLGITLVFFPGEEDMLKELVKNVYSLNLRLAVSGDPDGLTIVSDKYREIAETELECDNE